MSKRESKISVQEIYKIFGPQPDQVLERARQGESKEKILEETGHTVGIRDISLEIEAGETFVVMGLSGSGKSTLIRHFNRLIEPTYGRILVDGQDVLKMNEAELTDLRRHRMSMVFQRFALLPHKTVLQNAVYGLEIAGVERAEAERRGREQIDLVGLSGFENQYPRQLSGGMQQRVGLARALAAGGEILLMDEAFSALDPLIRNDMQDQLIELQERLRKTIVFITHDLDEALRLGNHIAILKDGALSQAGTGEEILLNPADDYVARFVRDVNRGRVVTAGSVAATPRTIQENDCSTEVVQNMLADHPSDVIYVVDSDGRTVGALTAEAARSNGNGWRQALLEVKSVEDETVIEELLPLMIGSDLPVAITDEAGQLVGVVSRTEAMKALVRSERGVAS